MTERELKRLSREDLLEMLVAQSRELQRMQNQKTILITQLKCLNNDFEKTDTLHFTLGRRGLMAASLDIKTTKNELEELIRKCDSGEYSEWVMEQAAYYKKYEEEIAKGKYADAYKKEGKDDEYWKDGKADEYQKDGKADEYQKDGIADEYRQDASAENNTEGKSRPNWRFFETLRKIPAGWKKSSEKKKGSDAEERPDTEPYTDDFAEEDDYPEPGAAELLREETELPAEESVYTEAGTEVFAGDSSAEDAFAEKDVVALEDVFAAEDASATEDVFAAEDVSVAEDAYAAEDVAALEDIFAAEIVPADEDLHEAEEVIAGIDSDSDAGDIPDTDGDADPDIKD